MVVDEEVPMALMSSGGGGEERLEFLLTGEESSPWVLDETSSTCLAILDLDLNRFMFITAKIQQLHTKEPIKEQLTHTSNESNPKQTTMQSRRIIVYT